MANTDRARKLLVRTALVTSSTIATVIGAQNLAMLDASQLQLTSTPNPASVIIETPVVAVTPLPVIQAAPEIEIRLAAPSITILRQSGQTNSIQPVIAANPITQASASASIQPPIASQIIAPQPIIVPQVVPQRSRSSR